MTLEETRERRGFVTSPGRSVRQHSVRDKGKEDTCHLPYAKQQGFLLALLLKDLLVKERRGYELMFTDNVKHVLWLDNSDTGDKFVFSEAYGDDRNSPYTIIDRVRIDEIITDASGLRSYKLPQEEANRIE